MLSGRVRILTILSAPEAYALPNGTIRPRFFDGRTAHLSGEMAMLFERHGWITRDTPPKSEKGLVFVWKLTEKGRAELAHAL